MRILMHILMHILATARARRLTSLTLMLVVLAGAASAFWATGVQATPPAPTVSLTPPATPMIGSTITFPVTFTNSGTDVGYGPYVDLIMPPGADGNDGITFTSATYLGSTVTPTIQTFPVSGVLTNPLTGLSVSGPPGGQLVTLALPFGSYTSGQPPVTLQVTAAVSNFADVDTALTISGTGGFRFGADPIDNPATDPPIVGTTTNATVTPTIMTLAKTNSAPESETATGPNFPRTWTVSVGVAPGQTITNLTVTDRMPPNAVFLGITSTSPAGASVIAQPVTTGPTLTPQNQVIVSFPSVTGTGGTSDASVTFQFYVPDLDANSAAVLSPTTGAAAPVANDAAASGSWTPLDPRDPTQTVTIDPAGPENTVTAKSLAVQKSVSVVGGGASDPGATLEYTVNVQVSDYFRLKDLVLDDILSDGQTYATGFTPTLTLVQRGSTTITTGAIPGGDVTTTTDSACALSGAQKGSEHVSFDIGAAMTGLGRPNTELVGGRVGSAAGATTVQVKFRATIDTNYRCLIRPGNNGVVEGDSLANNVTGSASVLNTVTGVPTGSATTDTSATSVTVPRATLAKTLYAKNGSVLGAGPYTAAPGDVLTYRLRLQTPVSTFDNLHLDDFLPLPVLQASTPAKTSSAIPGANQWNFGPSDTFSSTVNPGFLPTVSSNSAQNSITFDYGDFNDLSNRASTIDLLFSTTVTTDPFADGLHLTNTVRSSQDNAPGSTLVADAIQEFVLQEPDVVVTKGVVATNRASGATFTPSTVGPVTFSAPGSAGTRFSGTVNATNLATSPIDSNVSGLDSGDLVTFAIVLQNTGSGPKGAFGVTFADTLPAGLSIPSGGAGLNLRVTDGAGTVLPSTDLGGGIFGSGLRLNDPSATQGALTAATPTAGTNIAVITFDLVVDAGVEFGTTKTNTATLAAFTNVPSGTNFIPAGRTDAATVTVRNPTIAKVVESTNQSFTTGTNVALGEQVHYTATITVPEGDGPASLFTDTPPSGTKILSVDSITPSSGALSTSVAGGFSQVLANATIGTNGSSLSLNFATLTNTDTDNTVAETIEIRYTAVVKNTNSRGASLTNTARYRWTPTGGSQQTVSATANVVVVTPNPQIAKSVNPTSGDAGDTATFTITVTNPAPGNTSAFDLTVADTIPAGLTVSGAVNCTPAGGASGVSTAGSSGNTVAVAIGALPVSGSVTCTVPTTVDVAYGAATITNTANLTWTTIPGTDPNEGTGSSSAQATFTRTGMTIAKALTSTSEASTTGSNVTIGETATYTLTVTLPEATMPNITVVDNVPAGMAYVAGSAQINTSSLAMSLNTPTITSGGASGDDVTFDFGGPYTNPGDNVANDTFTITLTLKVLDVPGNRGNPATVLPNSATGDIGHFTTPSNTVNVTVVEPHLAITKLFTPTSAAANDTVLVTVTVTNDGTSSAFDTVVTDPFDGTAFASLTPVATASGFSANVNTSGPNPTITWSGGTIPVGATAVFTVNATLRNDVVAGRTISNTATANTTTLPGGASGERTEPDVTATATLNSIAPDIAVTKTDGVTSTTPGSTLTYTITISNLGGRDATGVAATDTIPTGTTYVSSSNGGAYTAGSRTVSWPTFNLAAGANVTRTVTVTVDNPAAAGLNQIVNTATATDDGTHGPDPNPGNNTGTDTDTLNAQPSLALTKTDGVGSTTPGATLTYTINATNSGNQAATGVVLTDTIPPHTTFVSASNGGTYAAGVVTWPTTTLAGGGGLLTRTVTITVDNPVPAGLTSITNTAHITDDGTNSPTPQTATATDTDTLTASPAFTITKTDGTDAAEPGETLTYTITVVNSGDQGATGVVVTDTIPANTAYVSSSDSGNFAAGVVTWPTTTLAGGATLTRTVTVTVNNPLPASVTSIVNTAHVTDDGTNSPTPQTGTATDTDLVGADLAIVKTRNGDAPIPGRTVSWTLTVTNNGPRPLTSVVLTDTLPATVTNPTYTASVGTYDVTTHNWSGLTLNAGDTITMVVSGTLDPAATGTLTNTATVTPPAGVTDPDTTNNTSTVTDTLTPQVTVSGTKTLVNGKLSAGGTAVYKIAGTNTGPSTATRFTIVDTLPSSLTATAASGDGLTCTIANPTVTCTANDPVAPGTTLTATVTTKVAAGTTGTVTNTARIEAENLTGTPSAPAETQAAAKVSAPAQLAFTGTDAQAPLRIGMLLATAGACLFGIGLAARRRDRRTTASGGAAGTN